jgi:hypothetical protein
VDCFDSSFTAFKGSFVWRDDGLLAGTFVFPSLTQKAADKNRRSQKPPAVWLCARTFGKRSKHEWRRLYRHPILTNDELK